MKNSRKNQLFRRILATTLLLGGTFQLAAPVLAEGTAAGTAIENQATATYEDPNNPGTSINATSNIVTVTVAEVAGITVTALPGTGPAVVGSDGAFSATPKTPSPGNIIEYRITYTNISTPPGVSGNVVLNAGGVVITEDGTTASNNWALDRDPARSPGANIIDTSNVVGSATDSGASTITFFTGNPATTAAIDQTGRTTTTDVTKYVNTVTGVVAPGQARTFQFQRRLN